MAKPLRFKAEIKRHQPQLPRFILVPAMVAAAFGESATFGASVRFGAGQAERKSIKPWGDGRWFMDVPAKLCETLGVDTGATIMVEVAPVAEAMPKALSDAIAAAGVERAWLALTPAQRRMTAENIYAAKRVETVNNRVAAVVAALRALPAKKP